VPEPASEPYRPEDAAPPKLDCREFKGRIARDWLICSFSYFKAGKQEELPDRDNVPPAKKEEIPGAGIFAFPKGAKAGTCLHEILQKLDFGATDEVWRRWPMRGCKRTTWPSPAMPRRRAKPCGQL
jgi:exodeoxyribonuclease V beta subunit